MLPARQHAAFLPASPAQVLHQRLESLPGRVFQPNTIELVSRKVGDGARRRHILRGSFCLSCRCSTCAVSPAARV